MTPEQPPFVCLACGGPIAECLEQIGSLRCHDCRAGNKPLRPEFALPAGAGTSLRAEPLVFAPQPGKREERPGDSE